jgi:PAS domain S-box-containing protein
MPFLERERNAKMFAAIEANKQSWKYLEVTNIHKNGSLVILESSGVPVYNAEGKFQGYRGVARDIT